MDDGWASGGAAFRSSGHAAGGAAGVCAQRWRPFPPVRQAVCAVPDKHVLVRITVMEVKGGCGAVLLGNTPGYPPRSRQHTGGRHARHATAALSSVQFEQTDRLDRR
ncbi:hypothetical protein QTP88_026082 [Uroleucon formosanum]